MDNILKIVYDNEGSMGNQGRWVGGTKGEISPEKYLDNLEYLDCPFFIFFSQLTDYHKFPV